MGQNKALSKIAFGLRFPSLAGNLKDEKIHHGFAENPDLRQKSSQFNDYGIILSKIYKLLHADINIFFLDPVLVCIFTALQNFFIYE